MTGFWIGLAVWPALSLAFLGVGVVLYQIDRWHQRRRERRVIDAAIVAQAGVLQFPMTPEARERVWKRIRHTLDAAREESA